MARPRKYFFLGFQNFPATSPKDFVVGDTLHLRGGFGINPSPEEKAYTIIKIHPRRGGVTVTKVG